MKDITKTEKTSSNFEMCDGIFLFLMSYKQRTCGLNIANITAGTFAATSQSLKLLLAFSYDKLIIVSHYPADMSTFDTHL